MSNYLLIDKQDYINSINLYLGLYYPLKGFVTSDEFKQIIYKKKILGLNFSIPINIFCPKKKIEQINIGEKVYLKYKTDIIGYLIPKSKFKININHFLKSIFLTTNTKHPGVNYYLEKIRSNPYSIGGKVHIYKYKISKFFRYNNFDLIKQLKKNKHRDAVFSTRNIPHIGHNLIQKKILMNKKKLSIFLILTIKNKYNYDLLMNSYKVLKKNKIFKNIKIFFIQLPSFFAGPNEAFFQAKIFENLKFKYFYVGRDHAGHNSYYSKFQSQKIFKKLKTNIQIIKFNEPMFCNYCSQSVINKFVNKRCCPICKKDNLSELNGTDIKRLIKKKQKTMLSRYLDKFIYNYLKKNNFHLQIY